MLTDFTYSEPKFNSGMELSHKKKKKIERKGKKQKTS